MKVSASDRTGGRARLNGCADTCGISRQEQAARKGGMLIPAAE